MPMKLNISNPGLGQQKTFEIQDDHKLMPFFEKRMGAEVPGDTLGDEFKGYLFKIAGGNDKQGFPMKQGVLVPSRVRILFSKGMSCYRERRKGMRKRKSVRGCIVGQDLSILNLVVLTKGPADIPGLTDGTPEKRKGPKRATKIRKLFSLEKTDDVRKYVVRRTLTEKKNKAPKIQRLITSERLQRKRLFKSQRRNKIQKNREDKATYMKRLHEYHSQKKERRAAEVAKKKASKKKQGVEAGAAAKAAEATVKKADRKRK